MRLYEKKCIPCRGDIPPFTKEQIDEYLKYLTDWQVQFNEKKALDEVLSPNTYKFIAFSRKQAAIKIL
jgi:4a-hydroxytetrahydrobiopterin dehydratase